MSLRASANVSELIAATLQEEMARDSQTILLGEDVGYSGGTFGASRKLFREFGEWRVRDTPISEMGFTGMAVGLAMSGWRPIVELMFIDFIGGVSRAGLQRHGQEPLHVRRHGDDADHRPDGGREPSAWPRSTHRRCGGSSRTFPA